MSESEEVLKLVGLGAAAWSVGKPMVEKILGPTSDYLGKELATWTEKRATNLRKIFDQAGALLGDQIEVPGQVPPRVLKGILSEGSFAEDPVSTDYFGGVLASSRSGVSRDDRGVVFTSLIGRISSYQIRAHYVIYTCIRKLIHGRSLNLNMQPDRDSIRILIPLAEMISAMDFQTDEPIGTIIDHLTTGLLSEQLIGPRYAYGSEETARLIIGVNVPDMPALFMYTPSSLGFELYMWAHGKGNDSVNQFQHSEFLERKDISIPINSRLI